MDGLIHDLVFAWRALCRRPAVSILSAALIAIAIGMNTAVFATLDGLVFRKLDIPAPDRLIHINGESAGVWNAVPYSIVERLRARSDIFAGVSGWADVPSPVEVDGRTDNAPVVRADSDIYRVMGAHPQLGRVLTRDDTGPVAVISDEFWRNRLSADPHVLGRTVRTRKLTLTIVGVMPPEFSGMIANVSWDIAAPLDVFLAGNRPKAQALLDTVARLREGVSVELARRRIQEMWPQLLVETLPPGRSLEDWTADVGRTVRVESASRGRFFWREQYQRPLALLLGMAALLLLIVCSNLATVLLARALARQKEIAVRIALGAGRNRLIRAAFFESLLLAVAGGAISLPVAHWCTALGVSFLPLGNVPFHYAVRLDRMALTFAAALAIFTAFACGVLPAVRATRIGVMEAIRRGSGLAGAGRRIRQTLVAVQVALSAILITASLLFAMTLAGVAARPLGFHSDGIVALTMQGKYPDSTAGRSYFDELLRRLRTLPGVERASISNELPMQYGVLDMTGEASIGAGESTPAESHCAFPDYFATLGSRMIEGREFSAPDAHSVVISSELSRRLFGGESAVGRLLRVKKDRKTYKVEVAGVVEDMKYASPRDEPRPAFYLACLAQWTPREAGTVGMAIALRGAGSLLERAARRQVDALGIHYVIKSAPLRTWVDQRMLRERMLAVISSVFGAVTLAVVAVGLYGLIAFVVASQTRDIAVRMALGAQRSNVVWLMARQMLLIVAVGLAVGLGGAAAGTRLIGAYLFGVSPLGPVVPGITVLALIVIASAASLVPIRRALTLTPMTILRHD